MIISQFLLNSPLYTSIEWPENEDEDDDYDEFTDQLSQYKLAKNILSFTDVFDGPCPICEKETTYRRIPVNGHIIKSHDAENILTLPYNLTVTLKFCCSREQKHEIAIVLTSIPAERKLIKIGQYPTLSNLTDYENLKYRKILGEKYMEYTRAIGLASHGVGIGSIVYLRRIFETLIEEAHKEAQKDAAWDEKEYVKGRMDERIGLLNHFLPDFLVKNKVMYGILSKGVHELSENECLEIFPVVRFGIEIILDEKIAILEKSNKLKAATAAINSAAKKMK